MKKTDGGITAPQGFLAAGVNAGIKNNEKDDMAMIYSVQPAIAAGVYTSNLVKAAPVKWDRALTEGSGPIQAVVVNSGIANAATGEEGMRCCRETAETAGVCLGIPAETVAVASTGVIGRQLPMEKITAGVRALSGALGAEREKAGEAAAAIMTTDTKPKEIALQLEIGGKTVTIGGMCKGSGMIHPNMCTMLCFITTDAAISKEMLQKALSLIVRDTFNMISVDGDTSTNDTVLVLANGLAGNPLIEEEDESWKCFCGGLYEVMRELSRKIAGDGEGFTCLFTGKVVGAASEEQAKTIAKSVICSSLTKAAIFGHDANVGRILCAMGYSGAAFDPDIVDITLESSAGSIQVVENGVPTDYSEEKATEILSREEVIAIMDLKQGNQTAEAWGCDLTYDYVRINGDYRS